MPLLNLLFDLLASAPGRGRCVRRRRRPALNIDVLEARLSPSISAVRAADGSSGREGSLSGDGRWLVFVEIPFDLAKGQFLHRKDLQQNSTARLDPKDIDRLTLSRDGRFLAFQGGGIILRDLETGTDRRIDVDDNGAAAELTAFNAALSADGRFATFVSRGFDSDTSFDVFRKDVQTGALVHVSRTNSIVSGRPPALSDDGNRVAFALDGTILVKDMTTQQTMAAGAAASATDVSLSGDGQRLVFVSANGPAGPGVYVHDFGAGSTTLVSATGDGVPADADSSSPRISGDGNVVVFTSLADNLANTPPNGPRQVYAKDLRTGEVRLVSASDNGVPGNGDSLRPLINTDGTVIAFESLASNLVANDTAASLDLFVTGPAIVVDPLPAPQPVVTATPAPIPIPAAVPAPVAAPTPVRNIAPVNIVPRQLVARRSRARIMRVAIRDRDSRSNRVRVALSASAGRFLLNPRALRVRGLVVRGNNTRRLTLTGNIATLNRLLRSLRFQPTSRPGLVRIAMLTNDLDRRGARIDRDVIRIRVT